MTERSRETWTVPRHGESVKTKLLRIAEKARREPKFRFTSLFHVMNEELLRGCFRELRKEAAAGIDGVTKEMYAEGLEERLTELVGRLQRMGYIPRPVRRRYIPKPGGSEKPPLGVPPLAQARFWGVNNNWNRVEILWHRWETTQQQRTQNPT